MQYLEEAKLYNYIDMINTCVNTVVYEVCRTDLSENCLTKSLNAMSAFENTVGDIHLILLPCETIIKEKEIHSLEKINNTREA